MRKWFMTLAVLGVGGMAAFLLTEKGQETVRRLLQRFDGVSDRWGEWNESAEAELENIRAAVNQIAKSLEPHAEPGPLS
ncbi:MAG TPA: hypothetical protein VMU45_09355 [Candidatus Eisenbacteria bacterium]|nr:hypothetical protein [Candidatus Eisenbacteria bacterium]